MSLEIHGAVHGLLGSDPIPGLGIKWAYISGDGSSISCPASSSTRIDADDSNFYTNAPDTFDTDTNTGVMGVRILADGHYAYWMTIRPAVIPTAGDLYALVVEGGGQVPDVSLNGASSVIFPSGASINVGVLVSSGLMAVGDFTSAPTDAIICRIDNTGGGHTLHFYYSGLVVVQLDTIASDLD